MAGYTEDQGVGGVETLFGAGGKSIEEYAAEVGKSTDEVKYEYAALMEAQEKVMDNAANAYKTAGLSANEYMTQVTSFAAALTSSLDGQTDIAADVANTAIQDMSDNANKMGTSMEAIQNAYNGFAKQNYTMLDNLKLGFGGTKEEMQRLLDTAGELTGREYDISNFADIVDAIHAVQTEMGITGTTAKEAGSTIEGSTASVKAAWENLVTGIADENADLDLLIGNFVDSVATVGENIMPRLEVILSGVGDLVAKLAPVIGAEIPKLIADVLPSLLDAGIELVDGLLQGIGSALPQLAQAGMDMITTIGEGLVQYIPELVGKLPELISGVVEFITSNLPTLIDLGMDMIQSLSDGLLQAIPDLIDRFPEMILNIIGSLDESLPTVLEEGKDIINSLVNGLLDALPDLVAALPDIINSIVTFIADNLPAIIDAGIDILLNLAMGIVDAIPQLVEQLPEIISSITSTSADSFPKIIEAGAKLLTKLWDGITEMLPDILAKVPDLVKSFIDALESLWDGAVDIGKSIVSGLWDGISAMGQWIKDKIKNFVDGIVDAAKDLLGIHSPSRVFAGIGENVAAGLGDGISDGMASAAMATGELAETVTGIAAQKMGRLSSLMGSLGNIQARISGISTPGRLLSIPPISKFNIPDIARGAAVPTNMEFMAAKGNTRYAGAEGGNIEQALQNAMSNVHMDVNTSVEFKGTLSQLARVLQPYITVETNRREPQLISGGALQQ